MARTPLALWVAIALGLVPITARAQTVADVIPAMGPCQSHLVRGLSDQLLRAQVCAYPDSLVAFSHPNIRPGSDVNQYGSPEMVAALLSVAASNDLILNDAFRTVVMQYAYVATDQPGNADGCFGPADPGTSRHEFGNAVDLENYDARRGAMTAAGFIWAGSGDPVHFSTGPERRGTGVRTFQHLWNLNHPEAPIDEDGIYGPQTEGALRRSPAGGFATDGCAVDRDGDGSPEGVDCDDANPARHPGATESCDAVDEDCDTRIDEDVVSLCGGEGTCTPGMQVCAGGVWGACEGQVCNDPDAGRADASVRSGDAGVADGSLTSGGRTTLSGGCACSAGGGGNRHGGGAAGWFLVLGVLAWRRRRAIERLAPPR
jgi:MYXO-CTERM domain-containing protein